jgi:hypothetical protein
MFIRPDTEWNISTRDKMGYRKRPIGDIESCASQGCIMCKTVSKALPSTINQPPWLEARGVSCLPHWNQGAGRVEDIYISMAQEIIMLFPEEGMIGLQLPVHIN